MRQVTLVAGPPCAGKTTHVHRRAQPGDIILDQDVIGARAMTEGLAKVAAMTDGTAWVIRCCPGPHSRDALARQIRATNVVLLRPSDAELIDRAAHRPNPRRHIQAVRKWLQLEVAPPVARTQGVPTRTPKPRSKHRVGRPYRRAREQMHAVYGDTCIHCGHSGAGEADHVVPVAVDPDQPVDWRGMRPSHGANAPCPVCPGKKPGTGRACNQERGTKPIDAVFKPAIEW